MSEKRVLISLVTWNSAAYLPALFDSLRTQTEQSLELVITDNASTDGTVPLISELIPTLPFPTTLFREEVNTGFARAHNHHIREAIRRKSRFVFIVNPDCILEAHTIAILADTMAQHDRVASVGGKILRAHFVVRDGLTTLEKTSTIDSTGLVATRAHQWKERGYAEEDRGQFAEGLILGVSGACVLYRVRALLDVAYARQGKREFFDEDFFSYKEDVDLAWRFQLFEWSAWYTPHAIAWHHRTFGAERRARVSSTLRALSWRNQYFVFLKNNDWLSDIGGTLLTFFRECVKFFWIFLKEITTLRLLPSFIYLWVPMLKKRRWIMQHRKRSPQEMREVFRTFRSSSSITKQRGS